LERYQFLFENEMETDYIRRCGPVDATTRPKKSLKEKTRRRKIRRKKASEREKEVMKITFR
jgi:hypothetical protein